MHCLKQSVKAGLTRQMASRARVCRTGMFVARLLTHFGAVGIVVFFSAFAPATAAAATYSISSGSTTPTSVAPGQTVAIKANFSLGQAGTVATYFEIRNSSNVLLTDTAWNNQAFTAGQVRTNTWNFTVPSSWPAGTYRVAAGIFAADWSSTLYWVGSSSTLTVATSSSTTTTYSIANGSSTPSSAAPGQALAIKADFRLSQAGTVATYFEIRNSSDVLLTDTAWNNQAFSAGQVRSYTWNFTVPSNWPVGTYKVHAGIFAADWSKTLQWVAGSSSFAVSTSTTTPPPGTGRQFYVDNVGGSDSNIGTSSAAPWKSLAKVNGTTFQAGDVINFKRGSVWTGTLTVSRSGASGNPITFKDYGSGNAPLIQRATGPESSGFSRTVVITGSWIVLQNFRITNAHEAGILLDTAANHNVIRNNEITATGYGAAVYGQFNLLTQNYVHDLHIIVNNAGGGNYGAGCFFFQQAGSGGNELSYNRAINCRAPDSFFDFNGKFVEVFNNGDNLYIHHNYAENPQGFFEAGAGGGSRTATNIRFVCNVLVNSHADAAQPTGAFWFNTTGSYGITMSNFVFDNNTVYQRTGDGGVYRLFASSSDLSFMKVRNNIIYTDTQIANAGSFTRTNNLYYMVSGSGVGYSLGTGEKNSNPLFVNVSGRDFHLQLTSPAIDAGVDLGYTKDMDGTAVPQAVSSLLPDIGAYEYKP